MTEPNRSISARREAKGRNHLAARESLEGCGSRDTVGIATLISLLVALSAAPAAANPDTLVPSAAAWLDFDYQLDSSVLRREAVGAGNDPLQPLPRNRDLAFRQVRQLITPRADVAIYRDSWLTFALPIVIGQDREISLDDGVAAETSSTLADQLLPMAGFDARAPGSPPPGDLVFRGVRRSGLDQLHLGVAVAAMNQRRDPSKPTWKLGAELRLGVGGVMTFDAAQPGAETAVGRGVHELRAWTSIARRYARTEGWFQLFWQAAIATQGDSLFSDPGFGATNTNLGQQAGTAFGIELYAVDDKLGHNQISLDLGGRLVAHFEGRDYSELWEVFALAGNSGAPGPLVLDSDPGTPGVQALDHPGISNVESFLESSARLALRAQLGRHVQFAARIDLMWRTDHAISFADAGIDLPTCGSAGGDCEEADNEIVDPNTREVNPLHVPRIDLVGHRYFADESFSLVLGAEARVLF